MASAPEQRAAHDAELAAPRDTTYWAKPVGRLDIAQVPTGAISLNVIGRRVAGPVQGFGQLWQKTYRVRLEGCAATPAEVVQAWKERLPRYQPTATKLHAWSLRCNQLPERTIPCMSSASASWAAQPSKRRSGRTSSSPWRPISTCRAA